MLTLNQIRAQVTAIRKKAPDAKVFGLRATQRWDGPGEFELAGTNHRILQGNSELQIRELLAEQSSTGEPLVLLTPLQESDLGEDLVARFARRRIYSIHAREILKELFQAKEIDPRLGGFRWMAEALLEVQPLEGFRPASQGKLDQETAWEAYLKFVLGLARSRPDLIDLLLWSRQADSAERIKSLPDVVLKEVVDWIMESAGVAGGAVITAMLAQREFSPTVLGLACTTLHADVSAPELSAAQGRSEKYFGDHHLDHSQGRVLAEAAIRLLDRLTDPEAKLECDRADALLKELRVDSWSHLGSASPVGFEQRLSQCGQLVSANLKKSDARTLSELRLAIKHATEHRQARLESDRVERLRMALRLVRWLPNSTRFSQDVSFGSLSQAYAKEISFVDWARYSLYHGESNSVLARAYAELLDLAGKEREKLNHVFAQRLAEWNQSGGGEGEVLPIERVLESRVAPAAAELRTLLIVLDGMSYAVYRELVEDIVRDGWAEALLPGMDRPLPVVAALPTITEWSRRVLLSGGLTIQPGNNEETAFQENPALKSVSRQEQPPALFLKGTLTERGGVGLSEDVRRELSSDKRQVVGVVINAVDDHLLKGDQLNVRWHLERIPLLKQLFDAAGESGRCVILTSDHGHVLDRDSENIRFEAGDRHRPFQGKPRTQELEMRGGRVSPLTGGAFIAPWSERIYYTFKKNGYHGGLTPQEVLVPGALFVQEHFAPETWKLVPQAYPSWWTEEMSTTPLIQPKPKQAKNAPIPDLELPLFATVVDGGGAHWVDRFLRSPMFTSQFEQAGRVAPSREKIRLILVALDERGGVLLKTALAQRAEVPEFRIPGLLAGLRRVLNVEGYPVLGVDEASGTVRLNRELLETQFDFKR